MNALLVGERLDRDVAQDVETSPFFLAISSSEIGFGVTSYRFHRNWYGKTVHRYTEPNSAAAWVLSCFRSVLPACPPWTDGMKTCV